MAEILVVDDDISLLNACTVGLKALGHSVRTAETGHDAINMAAVHAPDVIVLDLGLPDLDGLDVCQRIRTWTDTPIIILSADGSEERKIETLDGGADDYMTKPFGMRELDARIRVALRHHSPTSDAGGDGHIAAGPLNLDLAHYQVTINDRPVNFTPKEFELLAYLARNAGKTCTRRMILENVWGPEYVTENHYLKVYVYRIRKKLHDETGHLLQNDPAIGYRLAHNPAADTD